MPFNILIITGLFPSVPTDGLGNFTFHSAEALLRAGNNVSVLVTRPWTLKIFALINRDWKGMDHFFKQILKNHYLVNKELIDITLEKHKNGLAYNFQQPISIHIRLGSFKIGKQTTPLSWFVDTITKLRDRKNGGE